LQRSNSTLTRAVKVEMIKQSQFKIALICSLSQSSWRVKITLGTAVSVKITSMP